MAETTPADTAGTSFAMPEIVSGKTPSMSAVMLATGWLGGTLGDPARRTAIAQLIVDKQVNVRYLLLLRDHLDSILKAANVEPR